MNSEIPDLVLLDIGLQGMSGVEALKKIKKAHPHILVIIITAFEDIETVVSTMKLGAYDYVVKPIHMDSLKVTMDNALGTIKLQKEIQALQEKYIKENMPCFIGESDEILDVMEYVKKVAKSPDTPILITGESGTGKELIASTIHYKSPHFKGPFVALNCGAIPRELIESELFGYAGGAFSGADSSGKTGLIEKAVNGTLFLDEIGDLSPDAQAALLRFMENGTFYPLGSTRERKIRTRIISATNKPLKEMVHRNEFRLDLYYRLAVINIKIPSLNDRRRDITPIAKYFLHEFNQKQKKSIVGLSKSVEKFLSRRHWQGNIRELKNMIERGVIVGEGPELDITDLGVEPWMDESSPAGAPGEENDGYPVLPESGLDIYKLETHLIEQALVRTNNNDTKAARLLNMTYYAFRYRKQKLGL